LLATVFTVDSRVCDASRNSDKMSQQPYREQNQHDCFIYFVLVCNNLRLLHTNDMALFSNLTQQIQTTELILPEIGKQVYSVVVLQHRTSYQASNALCKMIGDRPLCLLQLQDFDPNPTTSIVEALLGNKSCNKLQNKHHDT